MRLFVAMTVAVFSVMLISCTESKTQSEQDLDAAKAATTQFNDVDSAITAGYAPTEECVPSMGFHYVNLPLASNPALDIAQPEILLYAPSDSGPRLVGIEYVFAIGPPGAPIPPSPPPAPVMFGQTFDGPMLGHGGGPPHYDLHVWTSQANPDGIFEAFNTEILC